jgi:hypothetical protein
MSINGQEPPFHIEQNLRFKGNTVTLFLNLDSSIHDGKEILIHQKTKFNEHNIYFVRFNFHLESNILSHHRT